MSTWLIFQQTATEGPGNLTKWMEEQGHTYKIVELWREPVPESPEGYRGLVLMGGHMSVHDEGKYPFLKDELDFIREWVAADRVICGICLGSQLLARALGAKVFRGEEPEVGWYPIQFTEEAGRDPLFRDFPDQYQVFHWHHETFELPDGAVLLASSELYPHQAFRYGEKIYGLQFHPEMTRDMIHDWIEFNRGELTAMGANLPQRIWFESRQHLNNLERLGRRMFERLSTLIEK